jgi:hypothetical protein
MVSHLKQILHKALFVLKILRIGELMSYEINEIVSKMEKFLLKATSSLMNGIFI